MKKSIRIGAALISAAMALYTLTGCEKAPEQNEAASGFTYWCAMPSAIVSVFQTMGEMRMYQELEERTGVHIDFIHPPAGQESEQFTLMVASGDLPDFVEYNWNSYAGGAEKALDDDVIIRLNELMDTEAPNAKKMIQSNENYDKLSKTDSGAYYCFPALNTGSYRIFGGLIVRQDWLDELGVEVPQTIDQWETVLRAFKEQKGASAPFTADASLVSSSGLTNAFNTAFNVGKGLYIDEGRVKFGPMEPQYREWLELMRRWYSEGLLDSDYDTNSASAIDAKVTNGYTGAFFGYVGSSMGRYLTMMQEEDPDFNLTGVPYPVKNLGDPVNFAALEADVLAGAALAVTSACADPAGAARWADFWYTEDGRMLSTYGVEGETYTMVDGQPTYTDEIMHNPDGLSISEALQRHCRATAASPGFNTEDGYIMQYYEFDQQVNAFQTWSTVTDNARAHLMPAITPTLEESEEYAALNTDINTYVSEMVFKFIHGVEPLENYDAFVQQLQQMKVERFIEMNQQAYDRYQAR